VATAFHVDLVAVEAQVWSGEAEMLIARTTEGEMAILAGHAPVLGQLKEPSRIRITLAGGGDAAYDVSGGFLSVADSRVTILAESCEPAKGADPTAVAAGLAQ
jgi:F-type H+-transporting ATPase subunit epsilon